MKKTLQVTFYLSWLFCLGLAYNECPPANETCEYWFLIEERLTMHWGNKRVYAKGGELYRHNEGPDNHQTKIPVDEVITMDGVERAVVVANNQNPGPPIIVHKGQRVVVHVTNHLLSESVTVHWHGIHQKGTPYSDGVAFITQCPIDAGQEFTYSFNATPHGTFFYHSHIGGQRLDGLFGALIVKEKNDAPNPAPEDVIMHVGDWYHDRGSLLHAKMIYGNFKTQPGFKQPETLDGVKFAPLIWKSGYVEGRGRYLDPVTGNWTETPLKIYNVTQYTIYRFRVIAAGLIYPLRVSIDNHTLTMVASDGYDFKPVIVESFILNPGERFDFLLNTTQLVDNYWIRVQSMESNFDHYVNAILRYNGASDSEPKSSRIPCSENNLCQVMNCPFKFFPKHANTECIQIDELEATESVDNSPSRSENDEEIEEHILNWVAGKDRMVINGNIFEHPTVSAYSQSKEIQKKKCDENCKNDGNCLCYNELTIPYGKTIQMIWTNHGKRGIRHHPIHLHGHSYHILKIGYGNYNETSGIYLSENTDINCGNTTYCNNPAWRNKTWGKNKIPGLKLKNAPVKDTLMLPAGGYAVIRFKADNPGKWFLHCHIEFHSMQGMAMVINEAPERHSPPPKGFPTCQNFLYNVTTEKDEDSKQTENKKLVKEDLYQYCIIALAVIIFIENVVVICCCCRKDPEKGKQKPLQMSTIS